MKVSMNVFFALSQLPTLGHFASQSTVRQLESRNHQRGGGSFRKQIKSIQFHPLSV